ncbi:hypothetical protein XAP412_880009 [Xanthomonas phaseoli pv. phaseoli]|uniref:Uncharacterized protein n=1 Tax=Xanthomonas campestris pv. phaseoli TaxID=317013 RepID=A0ABY1U0A7_XANCH|nr:hypothetical protein XAP6984_910009 [Xanthomonas phaseoli pv. phaseoli]SON91278.1 hypothetical protein XAP412_880009 [Xanthomonas phaseoli pv. phaseoli]
MRTVLNRTTTPATNTAMARNEVGNMCSPLQVVDLSLREYASALPATNAGHVQGGPGHNRCSRPLPHDRQRTRVHANAVRRYAART